MQTRGGSAGWLTGKMAKLGAAVPAVLSTCNFSLPQKRVQRARMLSARWNMDTGQYRMPPGRDTLNLSYLTGVTPDIDVQPVHFGDFRAC